MVKLNGLVVLMAVLVSTAWGQNLVPKSEFTGGYTYGSMDQNVGFGSTGRLNANGWNTGATAFLNNWFGIEGNVAGLSHSESLPAVVGVTGSVSEKHYTFVFGPRMSFGTGRANPYVHALFGLDRMSLSGTASVGGISASASGNNSAFATAIGGGLEYGFSKHFGITTGADYLMTRHGLPTIAGITLTTASATQNNFRVSAGVVVRFGDWGGASKR
jgi:hypothetical protein